MNYSVFLSTCGPTLSNDGQAPFLLPSLIRRATYMCGEALFVFIRLVTNSTQERFECRVTLQVPFEMFFRLEVSFTHWTHGTRLVAFGRGMQPLMKTEAATRPEAFAAVFTEGYVPCVVNFHQMFSTQGSTGEMRATNLTEEAIFCQVV